MKRKFILALGVAAITAVVSSPMVARAQSIASPQEVLDVFNWGVRTSGEECAQGDGDACQMNQLIGQFRRVLVAKYRACGASGDDSSPACVEVIGLLRQSTPMIRQLQAQMQRNGMGQGVSMNRPAFLR